ncbi:MAG: hemolysin family protein [Verrucomicrobia bacterium]|nr:hemolysin family protein [Verrucomicrobiota bacterium]
MNVACMVLLASSGKVYEWPTPGETVMYLSGIVLFLILNALFVAAEFAFVKVRPSQMEAEGKDSSSGGRAARKIVEDINPYLSAAQLGITIASLALGALGEPFIEKLVGPPLQEIPWFPPRLVATLSWVLAIGSFTMLHVVLGEQLPKMIAIRKALGTTLVLARPMRLFYKLCSLPIRMLNGASNWLARVIFRIEPGSEHDQAHSAHELALLVAESERSQEVTETEREILENALELNEVWVRDVMTHRGEVVVVDAGESFESTLALVRSTKHTRFPLVKDHLDNAIGFIHVKDLLRLVGEPKPDIMVIKRDLKVVPETMPLDMLLKFFLKEKTSLALVADEFGHASGVVFLDNVLEELVGDIQDEFDNERSSFTRLNDAEFVTPGTTTLNELADYDEDLYLESGEVTTVGGYITQQLGRFPEVGESITIRGYAAKVTSTDGRRVGQIHFRRLATTNGGAETLDKG